MSDTTQPPDDWLAPTEPPAPPPPVPQLETVDERLTKLEVAVAALADPTRLSQYAADAPGGLAPVALMHAVLPTLVGKAVDDAAAPHEPRFTDRFAFLRELHLMVRMYFDGRYRLSRLCQFAAPALFMMMVLNFLLFEFWEIPLISVIFPLVERLILIVLAVALYKVLAREAARYAAVLAYLAQYGR